MRVIKLEKKPRFLAYSAVGGKDEKNGPLGSLFDFCDQTQKFGMPTFEKAESEMGRMALNIALTKAHLSHDEIDLLIAGDLQNQCSASSLGVASFKIPFLEVYGACSTCTESLLLLSLLLNFSEFNYGAGVTTSHNSSAERQFRLPLEYGSLKTPTSQWTATAGGAFILTAKEEIFPLCQNVEICDVMIGRSVDGETADSSNMGGAMAFGALESIFEYFDNSGYSPKDFDFIVTGDLGKIGSSIVRDELAKKIPLAEGRHRDCGMLLYDLKNRKDFAGASGCGTSASVLATYFLPKLHTGEIENVLFLSTGALMSPTSTLQGSTISGIAPVIHLRHTRSEEKQERS